MGQLNRFGIAAAAAAAMSFVSLHAAQYGGAPAAPQPAAAQQQAQNVKTPRTADGHPDMSGMWGGGGGGGAAKPDEKGNLTILQRGRPCAETQAANGTCAPGVNFERDSGVTQRMGPEIPMYKPEFWDRVQYLDRNGVQEDSEFHCKPSGVPRMGPPSKIVQTPTELIFLYARANTFRVIPIDGRPHDKVNSEDQTYLGDSVGKWEGDTLVVDVVGFNDETWLAWPGYFHTNRMRVIERLTRDGNTLRYQATVEDPDVLMQPWTLDPRVLRLNPNPTTQIEDPPCVESDSANLYTKERG